MHEIEDLLDPTTTSTKVPVLPSHRVPTAAATAAAALSDNGTGKIAVLPVVCALLSQLLI